MWYFARGTGVTALALLTLSMLLGIAAATGVAIGPRFVVQGLHRNLTLVAIAFIGIHVALIVIDGYAPVRLVDAIIPFRSAYRSIGVGFGALTLDVLLAITISSLVRARIGYRAWRAIHWLAYGLWPLAAVHVLLTGTDRGATWLLVAGAAAAIAVLAAAGVRAAEGLRPR
jgi:sulfoxide reductase heme-binding subunit YedZ